MTRLARLRGRLRSTSPTDQAVRIALGLMLLSGAVAGTSASFNASDTNASAPTFAIDSLNPATDLVATAAGNAVNFTFTPGSAGSDSGTYTGCTTTTAASTGGAGGCTLPSTWGHRIREKNLGVETGTIDGQNPPTTAECNDSTAWATTTLANTILPTHTATTAADSGVATGVQGSYWCYKIDSVWPTATITPTWVSQNVVAAEQIVLVQVGVALHSVQFVNGNGSATTLGAGDSIVVRYIQPMNTTTTAINDTGWTGSAFTGHSICVKNGQRLIIARTATSPTCGNTDASVVGYLPATIATTTNSSWQVDWTWSDCPVANQCRMLTGLLGTSRGTNATAAITNYLSASFVPINTLRSATGNIQVCTVANNVSTPVACRPTPFGTL